MTSLGTEFTTAVDAMRKKKKHRLEDEFELFDELIEKLSLPAEAHGANIYQNIHVYPFPESTPFDRFIAITRERENVILGTPHRDTILDDDMVQVEYVRNSTTVPVSTFSTTATNTRKDRRFIVPVDELPTFIDDLIDHLTKTGY